MFTRFRQNSVFAVAFCVAVGLSLALPVDQFIELARLVIQVALSFVGVVLVVFVAPGIVFSDWPKDVRRTIRSLRLAQGWILVQPLPFIATAPCGTPSPFFRPPCSIS